jgi:cytochrome c biogenesis protein CcmG, thiol:disulfide interchange protein DsbE
VRPDHDTPYVLRAIRRIRDVHLQQQDLHVCRRRRGRIVHGPDDAVSGQQAEGDVLRVLRSLSIVGACALAVCACGGPTEVSMPRTTSPSPLAVAVAPKEDFALDSLTTPGKASVENGKVTLLIFWATWNAPCKKSFPMLAALQTKFASRGFTVVALSVDDEPSAVADAARDWGANFPVAWDKGHTVAQAWQVPRMPTIYLLDRKRKIAHVHEGWHEGQDDEMTPEIEVLLAQAR